MRASRLTGHRRRHLPRSCICWRGPAARISCSSSRCGSCSPRSSRRPAAPSTRRPHHGDRGGHRAGDRAASSRIPRCSATTRRSPRWSGLLAAVAGGDVVCADRIGDRRLAVLAAVDDRDRRRSPGCSCPALVQPGRRPISIASVPIPRAWRCSKRGRCFSTPATGRGRSRGSFFRSGFYVGADRGGRRWRSSTWRSRRADHLLIVCFTVANYRGDGRTEPLRLLPRARHGGRDAVAGRRRCSIGAACRTPDNPTPTIRRPLPFQREIAVIAVAGVDRRAEPRAGGDHHDARGRHAGLLVRGDAVAAHEHAGAVRLAPIITYARYDGGESAGELQRHELVGPGLLDHADRPARAGQQSHAERRADRGREFLTATDEAEALATARRRSARAT